MDASEDVGDEPDALLKVRGSLNVLLLLQIMNFRQTTEEMVIRPDLL